MTTPVNMVTAIRQCGICGAVTYIQIIINDQVGTPSGDPDKHAEWHRSLHE